MAQEPKWKVDEVPSAGAARKIFTDEKIVGIMVPGCYGNTDMVIREITDELHHLGVSKADPNEMFTKAIMVKQNDKRYDLFIGFNPGSKINEPDLVAWADKNEMQIIGLTGLTSEAVRIDLDKLSKHEVIFKNEYKTYNCIVNFEQYGNGRIAMELVDKKDGEPVVMATVNIPGEHIESDEVIIKNYSENEGVLDALIKAGIISKPERYVKTGHVEVPVCKLLIKENQNTNEMNTFDVKKRQIMSFDDFCKNGTLEDKNLKLLKGRTGIVKDAMSGEEQGPKGYGTMEDPKRINIKESVANLDQLSDEELDQKYLEAISDDESKELETEMKKRNLL